VAAAAVLATASYEIVRCVRAKRKVTHRLWTGIALAPLGRLGYVPRAGAGADGESPALARGVVTGALAGLSFGYGAYLVVLAGTPL